MPTKLYTIELPKEPHFDRFVVMRFKDKDEGMMKLLELKAQYPERVYHLYEIVLYRSRKRIYPHLT